MEHDCENCPSKGHCDTESLARAVTEGYKARGIEGIREAFKPIFASDLSQKDNEEKLLVSLSVALELLLAKPYQDATALASALKADCPEPHATMLQGMLTFHIMQITQKMVAKAMERLSAFGSAFGVTLYQTTLDADGEFQTEPYAGHPAGLMN